MKYILILIRTIVCALLLAVQFFVKSIVSVIIFLWDFKLDKTSHSFWLKYHFLIPFIIVGYFCWEADTIKDFLTGKWKMVWF